MKITYLGHSGFLVELKDCAFLFDYYNGELPELSTDTTLYTFVSHSHYDHFNNEIFSLISKYPNITYILSHDIQPLLTETAARKKACMHPEIINRIHYMNPDETQTFPHFIVKTTDSTDIGVSFLVTLTGGKTIFHAGDLNWWTWVKEETEEEYLAMTKAFRTEVAKLTNDHIDVAFLPLDPRQQDRFFWGFHYYMKHLDIDAAIAMHFWDDASVIDRLFSLECSEDYQDKIHPLRKSADHCIL